MPSNRSTRANFTGLVLMIAMLAACAGAEQPDVLLQRAELAYQQGHDKAAVIDAKSALQQNPALVPARVLLARLHNRAFDAAAAEKEIVKAVTLGLDPQLALPVLGRALLLQNKFQELLDASDAGAATATPEVLSMRGAAFAALRQPQPAELAYRQALAGEPDQIAALTGLGQQAMRTGDTATALRYGARLVAAHPQAADAWMFQGDLAYALRRQDTALAAYRRVLALDPGRASAHVLTGYLLVAKGDLDGAAAAMQAAGKAAPGSLVALYGQAMLDYNAGRYKSALDHLQAIRSRPVEHLPSVLLAGAVQLALGSLSQAEQDLLRYLVSAPDNAYARQLLATCLLHQGRPHDAVTQLLPLLGTDADPALLTLAGKAYMASADFVAATAMFERASIAAPKSAPLRTALGVSRLAQGQDEPALADLAAGAALEHGPASAARLALATTALRLGHHEQALAALAALERDAATDPAPVYLRGAVYGAMHQPAQARIAYERALVLRPGYFLALQGLVYMDVAQGNFSAAEARLVAVVKAQPRNVAALTLLAELAFTRARPDAALAWLRQGAAVDSGAVAPALGLARALLASGNPAHAAEALTLMRTFQPAHPDHPELLDMLGLAQLGAGDTGGALESYGRLAALAPRNPLAHARLATVYVRRADPQAAERSLARAVALQPAYLPAQLALAQLHARQGRPAKALAVARQLQQQSANAAAGYSMEGDLRSVNAPLAALAAYDRAFVLQPTTALVIRQHILLTQAGQGALAAERIAAWQRTHRNDVAAASYLAQAYIHAGQYPAAIAQLLPALRQRPDDPVLLNNLAYAYQQDANPLARTTAEHAYRVAPRSVAVMDTLAWILLDGGDHARALPLLRTVVEQAPAAPAYRYHLAAALLQAGDHAGARREVDHLMGSKQQFAQLEQVRLLRKRLDSGPGAG